MSSSGSSTSSEYIGCLGLSSEEINNYWIFPGTPPKCQYTHHGGSSGSSSSNNGDPEDNTGGGSNGNGSNSDSSSGGGQTENQGGTNTDDQSEADNGNDGTDSNSNSSGSDNSNSNSTGSDSSSRNNDDLNQKGRNQGDDSYNKDETVSNDDFNNNNQYYEDYSNNNNYYNNNGNGNAGGQSDNGNANNPYQDFEIDKCDTYENLWLWDFSLTCSSENSLENCQCVFAEQLMQLGILSCDDASKCPKQCPVCSNCMKILGCSVSGNQIKGGAIQASSFLWIIATVAGVVVVGTIYYVRRRHFHNSGELGARLMENGAFPTAEEYGEPTVWLAPDTPPAQFEPSNEAAVASLDEDEDARDPMTPSPSENVWLAPVT